MAMITNDLAHSNATTLDKELDWFATVLDARLCLHLGQPCEVADVFDIPPPDLSGDDSPYADFVLHYGMSVPERLVLLLALIPSIRPQALDALLHKNAELDRGFSEFGGMRGLHHSGLLPTGETALFLLAGSDLSARFALMDMFDGRHYFAQHTILGLESVHRNEPPLSGTLTLSRSYVDLFTRGSVSAPSYGTDFPAQRISSNETWDDLVLEPHVMEQVGEIRSWLKHHRTIMDEWGFSRRMKPGYRSLFYGPPGTGKSMTAALIGKEMGRDVYRIDLSMVTSKYIGETEKNLARVFDYASQHDWILFFDEADALFGKRTQTKEAQDRYGNQEVAYLLQRIEEHLSVAILASNFKDNMDDAFIRRFHNIIHFPMPRSGERLNLWRKAFTEQVRLEEANMLEDIAPRYEVSGGAIMNIAHYAALRSAERGEPVITRADIELGVQKELQKEGRSL
jgi:hypothetical protein